MATKRISEFPLSPRQRQYLEAVERLASSRGFPPTLAELAIECRIHPSRSQQLAANLQRRGLVLRDPKVARSIRLARPSQE